MMTLQALSMLYHIVRGQTAHMMTLQALSMLYHVVRVNSSYDDTSGIVYVVPHCSSKQLT